MTPAEVVRAVFPDTEVAEICGIDRSQPVRWRQPREKGGTGGVVPMRHARQLYLAARDLGRALTAEELIVGRIIPDQRVTEADDYPSSPAVLRESAA